jgi:hypothetical protein
MDLQDLGAIGEFAGAFLLFVSLIYLTIQVRMARISRVADTTQRVREGHHQVFLTLATNRELAEKFCKKSKFRCGFHDDW